MTMTSVRYSRPALSFRRDNFYVNERVSTYTLPVYEHQLHHVWIRLLMAVGVISIWLNEHNIKQKSLGLRELKSYVSIHFNSKICDVYWYVGKSTAWDRFETNCWFFPQLFSSFRFFISDFCIVNLKLNPLQFIVREVYPGKRWPLIFYCFRNNLKHSEWFFLNF